jgi:CIC family chloride channel protein
MNFIAKIMELFGKGSKLSYNTIRYDHVMLAFLAVIIGLLAAYGVIAFRLVIANIELYTFQTDNFLTIPDDLAWWRILLIPIIGGLIVSFLVKSFTSLQRPSAVADVIAANALHDSKKM